MILKSRGIRTITNITPVCFSVIYPHHFVSRANPVYSAFSSHRTCIVVPMYITFALYYHVYWNSWTFNEPFYYFQVHLRNIRKPFEASLRKNISLLRLFANVTAFKGKECAYCGIIFILWGQCSWIIKMFLICWDTISSVTDLLHYIVGRFFLLNVCSDRNSWVRVSLEIHEYLFIY